MFDRVSAFLVLGTVLALPVGSLATEPRNLDTAKGEITRYVESGRYAQELAAVALKANRYLAKRLSEKIASDQKLAIVFDIDETTLSSLPHMVANDYGYVPDRWHRWVADGRAPALRPIQAVYDLAARHKVEIFFITGRRENQRPGTEKNLREVGYATWTKIYFKPDDSKGPSRSFKTGVRKQLTAEGYTIVANLGDQESDLAGGYAERTFKLPCPFYLTE